MALIYCDPVNGNDANSGLTFALRKKTLYAASLAAGPNSEIRIIKSPEPTVLGTCSWTDNSNTVTIPTGTVVNIENCESGWTSSTNVTNTYSSTRKEGSFSLSMAIGASFTTGKAAYKAVSMDLTGYQQLSFWVRQASGTVAPAGQVSIKLCSDTTGDTPVHSFDVPKLGVTGFWHCFTVDLGSGMGAIQSIAIYINSDLGAQTFLFDNILASKAPSAADSLSLVSLISKGTTDEPWLPIRSIVGTTVILDGYTNDTAINIHARYLGTTESVTSYKREPLRTPVGTSNTDTLAWSGTGGTYTGVTISGGWNDIDMSTITGETFLDGTNSQGYGIKHDSVRGCSYSNLSLVRYFYGTDFTNTVETVPTGLISFGTIAGCYIANTSGSALHGVTADIKNLCNCNAVGFNAGAFRMNVTIKNLFGFDSALSPGGIDSNFTVTNIGYLSNGIQPYSKNTQITIGTLKNTSGALFSISGGYKNTIKISNIGSISATNFITTFITARDIEFDLSGATLTVPYLISVPNATSITSGGAIIKNANLVITNRVIASDVLFENCTINGVPAAYTNANQGIWSFQNFNNTLGDSRHYSYAGVIQTATDQRQTGTGYSWKFSPNSNTSSTYPLELELAKLPISAESITFSIYIRRTDSSSTASIIAKKGQLGLTSDVISSSTVTGSWEKVTLTVTPTVQGVLTLHMQAYGTTPVWFDTFGVQE